MLPLNALISADADRVAKAGAAVRAFPRASSEGDCRPDRTYLDRGPNPPAAQNSDPKIVKGKVRGFARKAAVKMAADLLSFFALCCRFFLAYLFRTINAAISPALVTDFGLDAAETGLLASIYFLVFGLTEFQ